jgi:hypothetical protein
MKLLPVNKQPSMLDDEPGAGLEEKVALDQLEPLLATHASGRDPLAVSVT